MNTSPRPLRPPLPLIRPSYLPLGVKVPPEDFRQQHPHMCTFGEGVGEGEGVTRRKKGRGEGERGKGRGGREGGKYIEIEIDREMGYNLLCKKKNGKWRKCREPIHRNMPVPQQSTPYTSNGSP